MSFLDRFLIRPKDPFHGWGAPVTSAPPFDLHEMRLGILGFGDPIGESMHLGRPELAETHDPKVVQLTYARAGFCLEFYDGVLGYIGFLLGPDRYLPEGTVVAYSKPQVRNTLKGDAEFSRESTAWNITELLGTPHTTDTDESETILFYERRGVTMEFELDATTKTLKRWNLFPTDEP